MSEEKFNEPVQVPKSKKHWRLLTDKKMLIGEMLPELGAEMTIKSVAKETLRNKTGEETKPVLSFDGTQFKLVLNVTNMKAISKVLKTPFYEEWVGRKITLIPVKGTFFGEVQKVIRIKTTSREI